MKIAVLYLYLFDFLYIRKDVFAYGEKIIWIASGIEVDLSAFAYCVCYFWMPIQIWSKFFYGFFGRIDDIPVKILLDTRREYRKMSTS